MGGVVWRDGITVHPGSVQLIGIPELTDRPFGFCGNDFTLFNELDDDIIQQVDDSTHAVGSWLQSMGYRGAFGVDFLLVDGVPLFTEVNPRFQGSTHASAQLSIEQGEACILLEHLAAVLGVDAPPPRRLAALTKEAAPLSHIVLHARQNCSPFDPKSVLDAALSTDRVCRVDVVAPKHLQLDRGATVARVTVRDSVSASGFELSSEWRRAVQTWVMRDAFAQGGLGYDASDKGHY